MFNFKIYKQTQQNITLLHQRHWIHSSLFAQKCQEIQRKAKEQSWTKRSWNTDIRQCETDCWSQTVPEIYHTFSI